MKADVYERITGRIVAELEQGVRPWLKAVERRTCRRADHAPVAL
jgi:antirestriction protein ArdC